VKALFHVRLTAAVMEHALMVSVFVIRLTPVHHVNRK